MRKMTLFTHLSHFKEGNIEKIIDKIGKVIELCEKIKKG